MTTHVGTPRLPRLTPVGVRWSWLLQEAGAHLDGTVDAWRIYEVDLCMPDTGHELPEGPAVYGVLGLGEWLYCGQTLQPLRQRMRGHRNDRDIVRRAAKADRWSTVLAIQLKSSTPALEINKLERQGRELLRPRMGSRWPAV